LRQYFGSEADNTIVSSHAQRNVTKNAGKC